MPFVQVENGRTQKTGRSILSLILAHRQSCQLTCSGADAFDAPESPVPEKPPYDPPLLLPLLSYFPEYEKQTPVLRIHILRPKHVFASTFVARHARA